MEVTIAWFVGLCFLLALAFSGNTRGGNAFDNLANDSQDSGTLYGCVIPAVAILIILCVSIGVL